MKQLRTPARLAASAMVALTIAAGATATSTSAASAATATVGASACTHKVNLPTTTTTTVKFRVGPGKSYTAKGQLRPNTRGYWKCSKGKPGSGKSWGYIKVTSGVHKGQWGWVSAAYLTVPMQTD